MPKTKKILAWHFTNGTVLRDGQPLVVGKTYTHEGKVVICKSGYHASRRLIDALSFAPGAQVSRVECWGDVAEHNDKLVCRNRKVLWTVDATMILHEFACRVAEKALSKVDNPNPLFAATIAAKRAWMRGEISNDDLAAARAAARDAAWDAARAAARDAAWDAACVAAREAVWDDARDAAWDATRAAAWDDEQAAAWDAAWDAAREAMNTMLTEMVEQAHKEATE